MASRRMILKTAGAAAVVSAAGAVGWAWAPGAGAARTPWKLAGESFGDARLDALAYAILAPNPHNRQPWRFQLVGENRIDVSCDLDRLLPHTDPYDRQIVIGFGAMLELLAMAAAEKGYAVDIDYFPDGAATPRLDERRIASVTFNVGARVARDPLFQDILQRRTTRAPFDPDRPVEPGILETIKQAAADPSSVDGTVDLEKRVRLIDLAKRGWLVEYETDATRRESIDLMRIGNRAVAKNPDGIALNGTAMGLLKMAGVITPKTLDRPGASAYEQGLSRYAALIESAQGFIWTTSETNTRDDQINAGRDWVRIHLAAQRAGIAVQPLSQVLQEFPEMAALYKESQEELGVSAPGVIQMLARIGYSSFPAPSPRWPLSSRLVDATA